MSGNISRYQIHILPDGKRKQTNTNTGHYTLYDPNGQYIGDFDERGVKKTKEWHNNQRLTNPEYVPEIEPETEEGDQKIQEEQQKQKQKGGKRKIRKYSIKKKKSNRSKKVKKTRKH